MSSVRVHVLLQGHLYNVGDSVLRRSYADHLRRIGPLYCWAGAGPDAVGYVDGLGLQPGDSTARSMMAWLVRAFVAALRGNAVVALNAGQYTLSRRYLLHSVGLIPLCMLVRARGGRVLWLGAAVPHARRGRTWVYRLLARTCTVLKWRDVVSPDIIGRGSVMPDWAFAHERAPQRARSRPYLTVTLRGDREAPSPQWEAAVARAAARLDLIPYVVVQVKEDDERAAALAHTLKAQVLPWTTSMHGRQEELVREVYAQSAVVLSDRLHALIMGLTEGAIPLGWCEHAAEKLVRHFEHVGFPDVAVPRDVVVARLDDLDMSTLERLADSAELAASEGAHGCAEVKRLLARD